MKKFAMMTLLLCSLSGAASAEQQIFNPYQTPRPLDLSVHETVQKQMEAQEMGTLRIYPGREAYGRNFGPIPRHPGDYRDAVDRGQWVSGRSNVGARSFTID